MPKITLTVKEFSVGLDNRQYKIVKITNSTRWSINDWLTKTELNSIIELKLADVTIS